VIDKPGTQQTVGVEEVMAAADALSAAGTKPTYAAVRDHLGKRGSYTTITKGMKAWQARAEREDAQDSSPQPPEAVKTLFDRLWGATWAEAAKGASASFEAERSRLQQETQAAAEAADQAAGYVRQLEKEVEGWESRHASAETEISRLSQTLDEKQSELGASAVRLAQAEERIKQLEQRLALAQEQLAASNELNRSLAKLLEAKEGEKAKGGAGDAG
jgi:chromosome segregation ATPase